MYMISYIHIVYDVVYDAVYDVVSFPDTIGGLKSGGRERQMTGYA